jgi:hypothetical protein
MLTINDVSKQAAATESAFRNVLKHEYTWLATVVFSVLAVFGAIKDLEKSTELTNKAVTSIEQSLTETINDVKLESREKEVRIRELEIRVSQLEQSNKQ